LILSYISITNYNIKYALGRHQSNLPNDIPLLDKSDFIFALHKKKCSILDSQMESSREMRE